MEPITLPDMERLATLVAVVDAGTFHGASSSRFLSASAVQKQMRSLERDLGIVLFERSGRNVLVTPAARSLVGATSEALRSCVALQDAIERLRQPMSIGIRVACEPIHMANFLSVAARKFEEETNISVELVPVPAEQFRDADALVRSIRVGEVDTAVTMSELPGCSSASLQTARLVAVSSSSGNQQNSGNTCTVEMLTDRTIFAQPSTVWSRVQLERLAAEAGVTLRVITESIPEVCVALAVADMGIAVLPDYGLTLTSNSGTPILDSTGKSVIGEIKAHWHPANESEQLRSFVSFVQKSGLNQSLEVLDSAVH